jgi:hypothetical protein
MNSAPLWRSPQTCHQGPQKIQTLHQAQAKEKGETIRLSERGNHQSNEKNLACCKSSLFKTVQNYAAGLAGEGVRTFCRLPAALSNFS